MSFKDSITILKRGPMIEELVLRFETTDDQPSFYALIKIELMADGRWSDKWWVESWYYENPFDNEASYFEMQEPALSWICDHIHDMLRERRV